MMCWSCKVNIHRHHKAFLPEVSFFHTLTLLKGSKVDISQADAVPKCDTVEVEKQIEVF